MPENHTLKGKDITIPLRANPKQANPDLLELPKENDHRPALQFRQHRGMYKY